MVTWADPEALWADVGTTWETIAGSDGIGAGDVAGIGVVEGVGYAEHTGAGDVTGIGAIEGVGYVMAQAGDSIIGVGRLEGDGFALGVPVNLTIWPISSQHLHIEWDLGGGAPRFVELERQRWGGASWVETTLFSYLYADPGQFTPATSYEDTTVVTGELYRYRVQAVGA